MSKGLEIRSQIDTETVKALLIINGGGAVAMLGLFPQLLDKKPYAQLASAMLLGVLIFVFGLACAVTHNRLRRICSLHYEQHNMKPPRGTLLGFELWAPLVCCTSTAFMWLSIASFPAAALYVAYRGISVIN